MKYTLYNNEQMKVRGVKEWTKIKRCSELEYKFHCDLI